MMQWGPSMRSFRRDDSVRRHRRSRPAPLERWVRQRDAIYAQVMDRGWDPQRRAFVQRYGSPVLDSSLLRMSALGTSLSNDSELGQRVPW